MGNQAESYYPYTKYVFDISKAYLQLGISELPVPLLDLNLKDTNGTVEKIGTNQNVSIHANLYAFYWNMPVGRWEPIIEQFCPIINLTLGKQKYIVMDCHEIVLINLSADAVQILKLLGKDFESKGELAITDK